MKHSKIINFLLLGLIIIFGIHLLARILSVGASYIKVPFLNRVAGSLYPIEAEPFFRYGHDRYWQAKKSTPASKLILKESIQYLQKALKCNRFYYKPHYYLSEAYFLIYPQTRGTIKKGLASLQCAVRLQGGKDLILTGNVIRTMLDYWHYLEPDEKKRCIALLKKNINRFDEDTFEGFLSSWEKNCGDTSLFEGVMTDSPQFYNIVADTIAHREVDMELRQIYKLNHEIFTLNEVVQLYRQPEYSPVKQYEKLITLRTRLQENIWGYYLLVPENSFKKNIYRETLKQIDSQILQAYFRGGHWLYDERQRNDLQRFIIDMCNDLAMPKDFEELYDTLTNAKYFELKDERTQYTAVLIQSKMQDYLGVITRMESLMSNGFLTFQPQANSQSNSELQQRQNEKIEMMLALARAYIATRLQMKGLELLQTMENHFPDLVELHFLKMKIEAVIGSDKTGKVGRNDDYIRAVYGSRQVEVKDLIHQTNVYLLEDDRIEIKLSEELVGSDSFKTCHLMQVFADDCIVHEAYLSQCKNGITVKLKAFEKFSRIKLTVLLK